jgi:hypothetical protein
MPQLSDLLQGLHPDEPCASVIAQHEEVDGVSQYSLTFNMGLRSDGVVNMLSKPLVPYIESFSTSDVRRSLKALRYPNNKIARLAGPEGRAYLRQIQPDVIGLVSVIDKDKPYEDVEADVHVYGRLEAGWFVGEQLATMNPNVLGRVMESAGVEVDALSLWRMKEGRKNKRLEDKTLISKGIDPERIRTSLLGNNFTEKTVVNQDGIDTVFLQRDELPEGRWVDQLTFIEFLKRMPNGEGVPTTQKEYDKLQRGLAERWRVILRDNGTPTHVVNPVLKWREPLIDLDKPEADQGNGDRDFYRDIVFSGAETYYSPLSHRVIHTSPVLGAAILAASTEQKYSEVLGQLYKRNPYITPPEQLYPIHAVGVLPLLLGRTGLQWELESSRFAQIEEYISQPY